MKIFNTTKLTKHQLRQAICKTAKNMGVKKVIFNSLAKRISGSYNPKSNIMFLDLKLTKKRLLDTFFHEMGHHFAVKHNKWKTYHFNLNDNITPEQVFNIENKIDKIGSNLWNKYVDNTQWGKYKYFYPIKNKKILIETFITK